MKREFKFRAWHVARKEMYEIFSFGNDHVFKNTMDGAGAPGVPDEISEVLIEQFSGILSTTSQEMYEGDVISWSVKTDGPIDKRLSAIIEFKDGCFMAGDRPLINLFKSSVIYHVTVDTNIHQDEWLVE